MDELMTDPYDVIVVGGGAAGVHGYLTRDGASPASLLAMGREEVRGYGATVVDGRVSSAERDSGGFTVTLDDGRAACARRLLVTTGLVDELPAVAGLRERWGRDVLHCPYCHGWPVLPWMVGTRPAHRRSGVRERRRTACTNWKDHP